MRLIITIKMIEKFINMKHQDFHLYVYLVLEILSEKKFHRVLEIVTELELM